MILAEKDEMKKIDIFTTERRYCPAISTEQGNRKSLPKLFNKRKLDEIAQQSKENKQN